jgi:hypothetical protein
MSACLLCHIAAEDDANGYRLCPECYGTMRGGNYRYLLRYLNKIEMIQPGSLSAYMRTRPRGIAQKITGDMLHNRFLLWEDPHIRKYQEEFLFCPAHISAAFYANQTGKTVGGTIKVACFITGDYPDKWPPHFRFRTPNIGRIFVKAQRKFHEDLLPKFRQWLPHWPYDDKSDGEYWEIQRPQGYITAARYMPTGSSFDVVTKEQDDDVVEGVVLHWAWADEPPKLPHFTGTLRGLMKNNGQFFITATPLSEPWMYREIYLKSKDGQHPDIAVHEADIWANSVENNGVLTRGAIQRLLDGCPPAEREAREKGIFVFVAGAAYPDIAKRQDIFIDLNREDFDKSWEVVSAMDFHTNEPTRVMWMAITPFNQRIFFDEAIFTGHVERIIANMIERERMWGINRVKLRVVDRSMSEDIKVVLDAKYEVFNAYRLANRLLMAMGEVPMRKVTGAENSVPIVQKEMEPRLFPQIGKVLQPFLISRGCGELMATLPLYKRDEYRSGPMKGLAKPGFDKGSAQGAHSVDTFHYLMALKETYTEVQEADRDPMSVGAMMDEYERGQARGDFIGEDLVDATDY